MLSEGRQVCRQTFFDSVDKSLQLGPTMVCACDIYIMHDCIKLCFRITCNFVQKAAACLVQGNLEKGFPCSARLSREN